MSREEIRESLDQLRSEVEELESGDRHVKERVNELIDDLEHQLENPEDSAHKSNVIEGMRKATEQFEVEHPRVTNILNHIMVTLGNMGI
jgi:predicted transcriptional regulator